MSRPVSSPCPQTLVPVGGAPLSSPTPLMISRSPVRSALMIPRMNNSFPPLSLLHLSTFRLSYYSRRSREPDRFRCCNRFGNLVRTRRYPMSNSRGRFPGFPLERSAERALQVQAREQKRSRKRVNQDRIVQRIDCTPRVSAASRLPVVRTRLLGGILPILQVRAFSGASGDGW